MFAKSNVCQKENAMQVLVKKENATMVSVKKKHELTVFAIHFRK